MREEATIAASAAPDGQGTKTDDSAGANTALIILLVVNLVWGGSLPATKLGLLEFSPFTLSWLRLSLSAVLFLAVLFGGRYARALRPSDWLRLLALGVIGYGGTIGLQTLGADGTTGAAAVVLGSTGPLFIALCASFLLHERLAWRTTAGLLVALAGVALVLGLDPADPALVDVRHLRGDLLVLGSAACFGLFAVVGKSAMARHSPLAVSGVTCLGGALTLLPFAGIELAAGSSQPGLLGLAVVVYLSAIVTFVGMLAWFWALRSVPAARGGAFLFLQPVSGVAIAAVLLGDSLTPPFLAGTGLVLGGLYLVARQ